MSQISIIFRARLPKSSLSPICSLLFIADWWSHYLSVPPKICISKNCCFVPLHVCKSQLHLFVGKVWECTALVYYYLRLGITSDLASSLERPLKEALVPHHRLARGKGKGGHAHAIPFPMGNLPFDAVRIRMPSTKTLVEMQKMVVNVYLILTWLV